MQNYRAAVSASKMFHEIRSNNAANRAVYGIFSVKKNGERYAKPSATESTPEVRRACTSAYG